MRHRVIASVVGVGVLLALALAGPRAGRPESVARGPGAQALPTAAPPTGATSTAHPVTTMPEVDNQTHGGVSDAVARQLAGVLMRTRQLEAWAITNRQVDLLTSLGPGDPARQALVALQRSGSGVVHLSQPFVVSRVVLVRLTDSDREILHLVDLGVDTVAWAATYSTPVSVSVSGEAGPPTGIIAVDGSADFIEIGTVVNDVRLGAIWHEQAFISCALAPDVSACPG